MTEIPDELRRYLEAVREANERLVEQKRRQLDPNLRDDEVPWLATENNQMRLQIAGFAHAPSPDDPEGPSEALTKEDAKALDEALVIQSGTWETWEDVFEAAQKMNAAIGKALDG